MIARPVRLMRELIVSDMLLHGTENGVSYGRMNSLVRFSSLRSFDYDTLAI